ALCDGLKEFELPISDKTVLIGATPKVRHSLAKKMRRSDIPVTASATAVDLGSDRAQPQLGFARYTDFGALHSRPESQLDCGALALSQKEYLGIRCAASLGTLYYDGGVRIIRAWPRIKTTLLAAGLKLWCKVKGPTGAAIATLLEASWDPASATTWRRTKDGYIEEWNLPPADDPDLLDADIRTVLQDLSEDLHKLLWTQAATHAHGDTLAGGADLVTIRIEQRRFLANGDFSDWALNNTIISGGQWTRDRLHNAGYQIDMNCDRCSAGVPETLVHRMWQCEANVGPEFEASDELLPRAVAGVDADPALWLRGIPSVALTTPTFEPLTGRDGWEFVGA
ncbi:unnamed protein product, partial [Prorocentrum cordatum]